MKELLEKVEAALEQCMQLVIVTAIAEVKPVTGAHPEIDWSKNPAVAITKINLIQGDIETVYDEKLMSGEFQAIRDLHAAREKQGQEIIARNVEVLRGLYRLATGQDEEGE
jgi:hypothetical protein